MQRRWPSVLLKAINELGDAAPFYLLHAGAVLLSLAAPLWMVAQSIRWGFLEPGGLSRFIADTGPRWWLLLGNSARVALPAVLIAVGLGTLLAVALVKTDLYGRRALAALLLLAALFPLYVTGGAMLGLFRREQWLGSAGLAGVIHGLAHLPLVTLIIGAGLRLVPAEYEEAALVEGAGPVRVLTRVTLRLALPAILGSALLVTLWTWTDYAITDILLVRTFAEEVYTQYALRPRAYDSVLIMWPQLLLLGGLLWLFRRHLLSGAWAEVAYAEPRRLRLGQGRVVISLLAGAVALGCVAAPIGSLVARIERFSEVPPMLTLFGPEMGVSATTSLLAGILCGGGAVGLAWWAARGRVSQALLGTFIAFMLAFPAPVLGMGLIALFNRPGLTGALYDSPLMLVIAYVVRFLPVAVVLLIPAVRAVPPECEMAARVDGCGTMGVWCRIFWPVCLPAVLEAAFVVTVLALGELPCSLLVTPPGYVTVTARFFSLIHYGLYADSAVLCLMSVAAVLVLWLGIVDLSRWRLLR